MRDPQSISDCAGSGHLCAARTERSESGRRKRLYQLPHELLTQDLSPVQSTTRRNFACMAQN
jgi:hypothetical protein